jgi:hypothetical protein
MFMCIVHTVYCVYLYIRAIQQSHKCYLFNKLVQNNTYNLEKNWYNNQATKRKPRNTNMQNDENSAQTVMNNTENDKNNKKQKE